MLLRSSTVLHSWTTVYVIYYCSELWNITVVNMDDMCMTWCMMKQCVSVSSTTKWLGWWLDYVIQWPCPLIFSIWCGKSLIYALLYFTFGWENWILLLLLSDVKLVTLPTCYTINNAAVGTYYCIISET